MTLRRAAIDELSLFHIRAFTFGHSERRSNEGGNSHAVSTLQASQIESSTRSLLVVLLHAGNTGDAPIDEQVCTSRRV